MLLKKSKQGPTERDFTPQQRAQLKKEFDLYDKDGDGFISLKDLKYVFGPKKSQTSIRDIIRKFDRNKDGRIDFREFQYAIKECYKEILKELKEFDLNGDGVITRENIKKSFRNMMNKAIDEEIRDVLKENGIREEERIGTEVVLLIFKTVCEGMSIETENNSHLNQMQVDQDSSKDEIKEMFQSMCEKTSEGMIRDIFDKVDVNKDGKFDLIDCAKLVFTFQEESEKK